MARLAWQRVADPITRNWVVVTGGSGLRLALGLVVSVLLARGLGPAGFGVFAVLAATGAIAGGFADFGLTGAAVRGVAADWPADPQRSAATWQTFVYLRLGAVALIALVGIALAGWLSAGMLDLAGQATLLRLTLLGVVATAASGAVSAMLQATSRFGHLTVVMLTNAIVTALLALLLVWLDALTLTTAILVLGIVPSLICAVVGYRLLPGRWSLGLPALLVARPIARELLRFGAWLWVAGVLGMVAAQVDVLLLNRWGDAATVGTYALAVGLASKADVINQSLHAVLLPAAAALRTPEDVRAFVRRGLARSAVVGLLLILLIPLAGPLIGTIYGARYLPAVGLFQALLVVALLDLFVTPLVMLAYTFDRPRLLAAHGLARVVGLGGGALLLIPAFGANGAVAARLAGSVSAAVVVLVFLIRQRSSSPEVAVEPV